MEVFMSKFIYATSDVIRGPWLLEEEALLDLDKIMDKEEARLKPLLEAKLKNDVDEHIANYYPTETQSEARYKVVESFQLKHYDYKGVREVIIYYSKNSKYVGHSFEEATRQTELLGAAPKRFTATFNSVLVSYEIEISEYDNELHIKASPETLPESREIFATLQRWASKYQSPKWQQWWSYLNGLQWVLWIILLIISYQFLTDPSREASENQARQLLKDGISQEEITKSIETLLALEIGGSLAGTKRKLPVWYNILLFGGLIVCIITCIVPRPTLGIGRGQRKIKYWKNYARVVFVVFPGFIFVNVIWPIVQDYFFK